MLKNLFKKHPTPPHSTPTPPNDLREISIPLKQFKRALRDFTLSNKFKEVTINRKLDILTDPKLSYIFHPSQIVAEFRPQTERGITLYAIDYKDNIYPVYISDTNILMIHNEPIDPSVIKTLNIMVI